LSLQSCYKPLSRRLQTCFLVMRFTCCTGCTSDLTHSSKSFMLLMSMLNSWRWIDLEINQMVSEQKNTLSRFLECYCKCRL
jgi:hypothetical protein